MAVVDISNRVIKRNKGQLVRWHVGFALRCMNRNENVGVVECVAGLALLSIANKEDLYLCLCGELIPVRQKKDNQAS